MTTAGLPAYQLVDELSDLVHADFLDQETYGFVGEVKNITNQTLVSLLSQGKLPLIPSLGYSEQGDLLNINADYLARAVAISLGAKKLILLTDVKGVLEKWSGFGAAEFCGRSEKNRFRCGYWRHDS